MQKLEDVISAEYGEALLDASLPASLLYEKRGYMTVKHEKLAVENGAVLVYEVMKKPLNRAKGETPYLSITIPAEVLKKLHITKLGAERIKKNLNLDADNIVDWCKQKIKKPNSHISRKGKNWYAAIDGCIITINAHSYTIITAHKEE